MKPARPPIVCLPADHPAAADVAAMYTRRRRRRRRQARAVWASTAAIVVAAYGGAWAMVHGWPW